MKSILKMNLFWPRLIAICSFTTISACSGPEEYDKLSIIKNKERPTHTIELIAFGTTPIDSINNQNRGYSADFYAYFNIDKDSVYTRQEIGFYEDQEITTKAGVRKNLASNKELLNLISLVKKLPPGQIDRTNVPHPGLYCGKNYCLVYRYGTTVKWYYFKKYNLQPEIEQFVDYANSEINAEWLLKVNTKFNEDSILSGVVNRTDFPRFAIFTPSKPPPPPVLSTIDFPPPVNKIR